MVDIREDQSIKSVCDAISKMLRKKRRVHSLQQFKQESKIVAEMAHKTRNLYFVACDKSGIYFISEFSYSLLFCSNVQMLQDGLRSNV